MNTSKPIIMYAKCKECQGIYIRGETSHPEMCGNCTYKRPVIISRKAEH